MKLLIISSKRIASSYCNILALKVGLLQIYNITYNM